ncbi:recombination-associated protein RdgC [Vibrio cholerae]|nr:recombination-associated protein RdgC [Vibrio cholerae]
MFPKNLLFYRINRDIQFDPEKMESLLGEFKLTQLGSQDKQKFGWVPALYDKSSALAHCSGGNILIRAQKSEKLIPASIISKMVKEKVEQLESEECRPLKKKEREQVREDIVIDILPTALIKESFTSLFILPSQSLIIVDASSYKKAEDALALLRKTLGSLPVVPIIPAVSVETTLTEWVKTAQVPSGFSIGNSAVMQSIIEKGAQVTLKNEELSAESIQKHIEENKVVTALSIDWQDRIKFTLKDTMAITRVKFADELKEQNDDIPREDLAARLDADFTLIAGELTAFCSHLIDALGGVSQQEEFAKPNEDKLTVEVADFIKQEQRASVTLIQRKFKIGYNQAVRIMERLESLQIVSKPNNNGQRTVLV